MIAAARQKGRIMKRVLVTGGSRGIGAECVRKFSKENCKVAFIYARSDEEADRISKETGAYAIKADVSDTLRAVEAVNKAVALLGGIDVLVNNAGIAHIGLFTDMTDEEIVKLFNVNLIGATVVARESAKAMLREHSGRIVNIGSVWGRTGASCEVVYSASKAGIEGLTKSLAKELGPSGITVNCVEPGVIYTDMNRELDETDMQVLCDQTPMCRIGKPEDIAEAVFWLASDKSDFVTGQIIGVDGGFAL